MPAAVVIRVSGRPIAEGNFNTAGGHVYHARSALLRRWRRACTLAYRRALGLPDRRRRGETALWGAGTPVRVDCEFHVRRGKGDEPLSWASNRHSPDTDKMVRAIFDALEGTAYEDDAQIVWVTARSKRADATGWLGAFVRVRRLDVEDPGESAYGEADVAELERRTSGAVG